MSLISEALRKAHMEAVRQDRGELRYYIGHGERTPGTHRVSRYGAIMIVLGGLCFATGAALFYLSLRSAQTVPDSSRPIAAASPVASPSATASASTATTASSEPEPAPARVEQAKKSAKKSDSLASAPPLKTRERKAHAAIVRESVTSEVPDLDGAVREKPTAPAPTLSTETRRAAAPSRRLSRDGFQEGETYGSPVLGPFGSEISLSGITALRGQSVAIVNGSTVRAGTAVGPFVIEEIEAGRIRVRYVDISFYVVQ